MDYRNYNKKFGYSFRIIGLLAFMVMGCSEKRGHIEETLDDIYAIDSIESCHDNIPSRFAGVVPQTVADGDSSRQTTIRKSLNE